MENETFTFAFYIPTRYHRVTENGVARSSHPLSIIAWTTQTKQKNAVKKKKKKKKKRLTPNVKAILSHFWLGFRSGRLFIFSTIWMLVGKRQYLQEIPLTTCSPNFSLATALVVKKEPS